MQGSVVAGWGPTGAVPYTWQCPSALASRTQEQNSASGSGRLATPLSLIPNPISCYFGAFHLILEHFKGHAYLYTLSFRVFQ